MVIAQGTLFNVMRQTGWEGSLTENGHTYTESLYYIPETIVIIN